MRHYETNLLWEVVEVRIQSRSERVIARFVYHEDAEDFFTRKVKAFSGRTEMEFDLRQGKKERRR